MPSGPDKRPRNALVYLLDDDQISGEISANILGGLDCTVEVYAHTEALLEGMRRKAPDAVFLDLQTVGVDSLKLSRRIREELALPGVKIVVMEPKSTTDKVSVSNVVADAYLEKPLGHAQVQALLQQLTAGKAEVRFWGVRGSIAAPGPSHDRYGGNTSCVTIKLALDEYIVFDAGTGIREFGNYLVRLGLPVRLHLLISHAHWDHIQGLPFFRPGYLDHNDMAFYGANQADTTFEKVIANQMHATYFPVPLEAMRAHLHFHPMQQGNYKVADSEVETLFLHHPGTTLGFRVDLRGKRLIYLCDNEITDNDLQYRRRLVNFLENADLLIADAQYVPSDFPDKRGWGHSAYTDVVDIALEAGVHRLVLTHHDPDRNDDALDEIVADSRRRIASRGSKLDCLAAAEGTALFL